jgi:hypothetical protein
MRSRDYRPSSLPPVHEVIVVSLVDEREPEPTATFFDAVRVARTVRVLDATTAQRAAFLWRRLRPAEQYRCHTPPYGFRFLIDDRLVVEASLCWECNNAFGRDAHGDVHFTFDPSLPAALELLDLAKAAFANPSG